MVATSEIILHGTELSGHTHRVELLLRMLGLPYRFEKAAADVRRRPEFRQTIWARNSMVAGTTGCCRARTALAIYSGRRGEVWTGHGADDHTMELPRRAC
jgi:hypothetical protein